MPAAAGVTSTVIVFWQIKDPSQAYDKRRLRELDFWFGTT